MQPFSEILGLLGTEDWVSILALLLAGMLEVWRTGVEACGFKRGALTLAAGRAVVCTTGVAVPARTPAFGVSLAGLLAADLAESVCLRVDVGRDALLLLLATVEGFGGALLVVLTVVGMSFRVERCVSKLFGPACHGSGK